MEMKTKKQMTKDKQPMQLHNHKQVSITEPSLAHHRRSDDHAVKLATIATSINVQLRSSDMPPNMQERALRSTRSFLDSAADSTSRPNPTQVARALKKEFDSLYGPAWHCVVGKSFGSFVTHSPGGFVYFSIDSLSVLLFKTEVQLVTQLKLGA